MVPAEHASRRRSRVQLLSMGNAWKSQMSRAEYIDGGNPCCVSALALMSRSSQVSGKLGDPVVARLKDDSISIENYSTCRKWHIGHASCLRGVFVMGNQLFRVPISFKNRYVPRETTDF